MADSSAVSFSDNSSPPPTAEKIDARSLWAEFLATALFVWAGCGAAVASNRWTEGTAFDAGALVSISLAFGLTISVLIYGIGFISGGHINPAVTFSFMLLKLRSVKVGLLYMLAQFAGATFGALVLWGCVSSLTSHCDEDIEGGANDVSGVCKASEKSSGGYGPAFGLGVNVVGPKVSLGSAFLIEVVGTYLLVFTVLLSAVHSKSTAANAAPIAIGWAVLVAHLVMIPFTGCGINPARSFGPMIVDLMGGLNFWIRGCWVFYTAPFVGSLLASLTFKYLFEVEFGQAYNHLKVSMKRMASIKKLKLDTDYDDEEEGDAPPLSPSSNK